MKQVLNKNWFCKLMVIIRTCTQYLTNTVYLDMNVPKWTKDNCTTIEVNIKTDCPSGI